MAYLGIGVFIEKLSLCAGLKRPFAFLYKEWNDTTLCSVWSESFGRGHLPYTLPIILPSWVGQTFIVQLGRIWARCIRMKCALCQWDRWICWQRELEVSSFIRIFNPLSITFPTEMAKIPTFYLNVVCPTSLIFLCYLIWILIWVVTLRFLF